VDEGYPGAPPQYAAPEDAYVAEVEEPERRGPGFGPWPRAKLGLLLVFIGACVLAGAFVLEVVGYLLMTINVIQALSGSLRMGMGLPAYALMLRIAEPLALGGSLTCLAGYVLCLLGPRQRGAMPLAIVTLSLGVLHLVLALIFRLALIYGVGLSPMGGPSSGFGVWFGLLLTQLFFGAELIMFPFYMRALCAIRKKHGAAGACMAPAIMAMAYTGLRLLGWILFYVMGRSTSEGAAKGMIWTNLILLWIGTIVFAIQITLYTQAVWRVRRAVSR